MPATLANILHYARQQSPEPGDRLHIPTHSLVPRKRSYIHDMDDMFCVCALEPVLGHTSQVQRLPARRYLPGATTTTRWDNNRSSSRTRGTRVPVARPPLMVDHGSSFAAVTCPTHSETMPQHSGHSSAYDSVPEADHLETQASAHSGKGGACTPFSCSHVNLQAHHTTDWWSQAANHAA